MRRYDVVSGILLVFSIIDFALAVPVLVQEKHQACVDVVHIAKDVVTALGKRGDNELEKLLEEYFNAMGKPVESSGPHASLSSASLGPDHGLTNVVQAPASNPASSTADPDPYYPVMEPSSPSWTVPMQANDWLDELLHNPAWAGYVSDHELTGAHALQPNPNKGPLTDPGPDDVISNKGDDEVHGILHAITSTDFGPDHELTGAHVLRPNQRPWTDPDFNMDYWTNSEDPESPGPVPAKRPKYDNQVEHVPVQQPNPRSSTEPDDDEVVLGPPSSQIQNFTQTIRVVERGLSR